MQGFLESVEGVTDKPLVVYPNSGETWSNENKFVENNNYFMTVQLDCNFLFYYSRWNGTKTNLNVHLPMWLEKGVRIAGKYVTFVGKDTHGQTII